MNKSEKKIRLAMIKAIGERRKIEIENKKLKGVIIKMACCGNCADTRIEQCGNCTHRYPGNSNCIDHWRFKK